jgi:hypothetical protein
MSFRLFPRYRRPSVGELLGTTQAKRKVGYYSAGAKFARFLLSLFGTDTLFGIA